MNIRRYIDNAIAALPNVVTPDMVSVACMELGVSPAGFCDHFAKEVARSYLAGELSWMEADAAMNALSGFFFMHIADGAPFPDYAFGVFLAFDDGEMLEEPENERIAKERLESLHEKSAETDV
jgi:hypothetical protein